MKNIKVKLKIVFIVLFVIFNVVMFYNILFNNAEYTKLNVVLYFGLSGIVIFILFLLYYYLCKKKVLEEEKIFLIMALILGSIYLFVTPLFKGHDELYQWYKAQSISIGNIVSVKSEDGMVGDMVSKKAGMLFSAHGGDFSNIKYKTNVSAFLNSDFKEEVNIDEEIFVENPNMATYPFIQMLPQALGIFISNLLGFNVYLQAMFGRVFNLLFFILLGYISIKILPSRKKFLMAFLLSPKVMYIAATLSGDVFTNSIIILFISYVFYFIGNKKELLKKDYIILSLLMVCVAVCKLVYLPICGLIFLIPKESFKKVKIKKIYTVSILIISVIMAFSWLNISYGMLGSDSPESTNQVKYILNNPVKYSVTVVKTLAENASDWTLDLVGGYMEWGQNLRQYPLISMFVYFILFLAFFSDTKKDFNLNLLEKSWMILIIICVTLLIETALYIQWSPQFDGVGGGIIYGVQGRYFTPIVLIIAILIPLKSIKFKNNIDIKLIYTLIIISQIPTFLNIIIRNI